MSRCRVLALGPVLALGLVLPACVPHTVGPARTYAKFEGKAASTAKAVLSEVETARLAADTAGRGRTFGSYVSVLMSEVEEGIGTAQSTFASIQPPNEDADALADELDGLVSDALDGVRELRLAARRGELGELAEKAAPLADASAALNRFIDAHS